MTRSHIFCSTYEKPFLDNGISNVVIRRYIHVHNNISDNPEGSTEIIFSPLCEASKKINEILVCAPLSVGLAITSCIGVRALVRYLFFLDCCVGVSDIHEAELLRALRIAKKDIQVLQNAMVLQTSNSYHIASFTPLTERQWQESMAKALLLRMGNGASIADSRYVGHSLDRGYNSLRVSDFENKKLPRFVDFL